jgi:hypothetical protein
MRCDRANGVQSLNESPLLSRVRIDIVIPIVGSELSSLVVGEYASHSELVSVDDLPSD